MVVGLGSGIEDVVVGGMFVVVMVCEVVVCEIAGGGGGVVGAGFRNWTVTVRPRAVLLLEFVGIIK